MTTINPIDLSFSSNEKIGTSNGEINEKKDELKEKTKTNDDNIFLKAAFRVRAANSEGFGTYASTLSDDNSSVTSNKNNKNESMSEVNVKSYAWLYFLLLFLMALCLVIIIIFLIGKYF